MSNRRAASPDRLQRCARIALEAGATVAKAIPAQKVVTAEWVRLKCQYGCGGYGKRLGCPPRTPTPEQTRRVIAEYRRAVIYAFDSNRTMRLRRKWVRLPAEIERQAFLDGHYKAFGLGAGPCRLCADCNADGLCRHPEIARPAMEACGIDVYATCRNAGIKLEVVTSAEATPRYVNLLLIE
ncbi:MAG: DUF2284 domain-containing protein [bacterium]